MRLVKPSVEILSMPESPLELIEAAGRTCYKSEEKITSNSAPKFVEMVLKRGHESVLEHASATVRFVCDRGVSHEIVRHRLAAYSQESTRYCDYSGGEVTFVIPPWVDMVPDDGLDMSTYFDICGHEGEAFWYNHMLYCEKAYQDLRDRGWKPEQARSVLPNSLKTEVVMTANFREWRHFFNLRTAPAAHPQMREVAIPLLKMFQYRVPSVFGGGE